MQLLFTPVPCGAPLTGVPHFGQNELPSGSAAPHFLQNMFPPDSLNDQCIAECIIQTEAVSLLLTRLTAPEPARHAEFTKAAYKQNTSCLFQQNAHQVKPHTVEASHPSQQDCTSGRSSGTALRLSGPWIRTEAVLSLRARSKSQPDGTAEPYDKSSVGDDGAQP